MGGADCIATLAIGLGSGALLVLFVFRKQIWH